MKKLILLAFLSICTLTSHATPQQVVSNYYTFEYQSDLSSWKVNDGKAEISTNLFKEGIHSLCWKAENNSKLEVTLNNYTPNPKLCAYFLFFNKEAQKGNIKVQFLNPQNKIVREATINLNFRGWREFNRSYDEFAQKVNETIHKVIFYYQSTESKPSTFYIDDVNFSAKGSNTEYPECFLTDKDVLNSRRSSLLRHYALYKTSIPTTQELTDIKTLKKAYKASFFKVTNADAVIAKVNAMNLTRNEDGTVSGPSFASAKNLTSNDLASLSKDMESLAYAAQRSKSDRKTFELYLDYILDQGVLYAMPKLVYSRYDDVRTIPKALINVLSECNGKQKEEMQKAIRWITELNLIYIQDDQIQKDISSDYLYNYLPHLYRFIMMEDDTQAASEIKAFSSFLGRCSEYHYGNEDLLKPDGTGFHHNVHYNGYMYSYKTWVEYIGKLSGTTFRIDEASYNRIKKAIVSIYLMSTRGKEGLHYYANSLSGRHPFTGMEISFTQNLFKELIAIGGDIQNKKIDTDLASKYNYFFKTKEYDVPEAQLDGFYQFNYSPIGVYRKDNWVATMRCPTTKFWGTEIYVRTNRLGRYSAHGTLEVLYEGDLLGASGYPANNGKENTGGWDWNMAPGATTVFYDSWRPLMPNGNINDRFDQYSKTTNYSGALSWGDKGLFSAEFDQGDDWGNPRYEPTNLTFKKTILAIDGLLIDMGSNISSKIENNQTRITATCLFQNIVENNNNGGVVDNKTLDYGNTINLKNDQSHWILNPASTGYIIPSKENGDITLIYNEQKTPNQVGTMLTKPDAKIAVKAYINHGFNPIDKKYIFIAVPAATQDRLNKLKQQIDKGELYQIISWDKNMHALHYLPANIYAYSCFEPTNNINGGKIQAVSSQALIMEKYDANKKELSIAVCNPNLNPQTTEDRNWTASPTPCKITLKGIWNIVGNNQIKSSINGNTTSIELVLNYGNAQYIQLKSK